MAKRWKGKQIFMEALKAEGITHIFGNPGTTELPLMDSLLEYPEFTYILSLHEGPAVTMADAFALTSGQVGVVNLHVGPGLGNGLGMVYNALKGKTPLLVTAGQQDNSMRLRDPLLGHDLVAMAEPLTKWSVEAATADEMPLVMHRALKAAQEHPAGPVFVSLPMNVMEAETNQPLMPLGSHMNASLPQPEALERMSALLLSSKRPIIFCGDFVARSGARDLLVELAEFCGAAVHTDVLPSLVNFPTQHPCFQGRGAGDQAALRKVMQGCDLVLMIGGEFFEELWFVDANPFPEDAVRIQIDPDPKNLARNYAVDCAVAADVRQSLQGLVQALKAEASPAWRKAAQGRLDELKALKQKEKEAQQMRVQAKTRTGRMSPARLMAELAECLPKNIAIAGEAITSTPDLTRSIPFNGDGDYLGGRGGGIGHGLPSAIGMKLAMPERPVLCIGGDGSSLYSVQAFWTAAYHRIPVVFLILSNQTYQILHLNMDRYRSMYGIGGERGYPHLSLNDPVVDFVRVAEGFGVKGQRVEKPEQVRTAIQEAFASGEPRVIQAEVDAG